MFKYCFGSVLPGSQPPTAKCWCFSAVPSSSGSPEGHDQQINIIQQSELPVVLLQESLLHFTPRMCPPNAVRLLKKTYRPIRTFYYIPYCFLQAASVVMYFNCFSVFHFSTSPLFSCSSSSHILKMCKWAVCHLSEGALHLFFLKWHGHMWKQYM